MNVIFFDDEKIKNLFPITMTRPSCELRIGIKKISEKWQYDLNISKYSFLTKDYLSKKYKTKIEDENLLINGRLLPNSDILSKIKLMNKGEALFKENTMLIAKLDKKSTLIFCENNTANNLKIDKIIIKNNVDIIEFIPDLFLNNKSALLYDFRKIKENIKNKSCEIEKHNTIIGNKENIFIEEGAKIYSSILNVEEMPIYIGKNVTIMEGSLIRGGLAICENSTLKMGSKIYGATTLGPHCKVGGEVSNTIILGYSNKGHDGFLGNSVIGEWCNLGADTNTSNLKNNYSKVSIWNYKEKQMKDTNLNFCGLIMGDHSKSGINTMFNTGTVVGVSANIFGADFPPKHIPSFSWGTNLKPFIFSKALTTAEIMMKRRNIKISEEDKNILKVIFEENNN